ncbi:MAG: DUF4349 domain-containing protein [Oscillospiraceae bacterium]|nr:DUF4349 domain-containing protein [Oscillospiraceae bacterium]
MKKIIALSLTGLLLLSILSACGAGLKSFDESAPMSAPMATPAPAEEYPAYSIAAGESYYDYAENGVAYASSAGAAGSTYIASAAAETPGEFLEKIIYTASAGIETVDFDQTISDVYAMIERYGAAVENSWVGNQSYYAGKHYRTAEFSIRVPKARYAEMASSLSVLGSVTYLSQNAQNVTAEYTDTESRLKTYRIEEERLLAMLEKADTVADMITIESSLSQVRYNIESLTSSLKNLQSRVDYSAVNLSVSEVEALTEQEPIHRTYGQQLGDGLQSTLKSVGSFFKALFKGIVIGLPVLALLAVIAVVIIIIVKKKRAAKKRETPAPQDKE